MRRLIAALLVLSLVKVDLVDRPAWAPLGQTDYDPDRRVFIDRYTFWDNWMMGLDQETHKNLTEPREIPAKRTIVVSLRANLFSEKRQYFVASSLLVVSEKPKRRFVLINPEQYLEKWHEGSRMWPHLGMLFVGTVAEEEGYEVTLWDEMIQGPVSLEKLVQPGDIVGLSLVVTGIERGVELARDAKRFGARHVIAGNDSAIFRSNQLLRIPDKPIDAVCTSNSLAAVRQFLRQIGSTNLEALRIPDIQVIPGGPEISNARARLLVELAERKRLKTQGRFEEDDVFIVPRFDLFPKSYWEQVRINYLSQFGQKHRKPDAVRNATSLLAQGCTRTRGTDVCTYCSIAGVADIRLPSREHLVALYEAYRRFGIDTVYNVTDSIYEMTPVVRALKKEGLSFNAMQIYGRAQGIARMPHLLDEWLSVTDERLLVNVGMDAADDTVLQLGVSKSSDQKGSRVAENRAAVEYIKKSGAHLHYSLVFGSPGETRDTIEKSMEFFEWTIQTLGDQLDLCETDIYWLNFGAPASRVFVDHAYAQRLAGLARKSISCDEWERNFARHAEELVVPLETEKAWFHFFTQIDIETAQEYNDRVAERMVRHAGSARPRAFRPAAS